MSKIKTSHNSMKKVLYSMSNRCVECNMKIPKGDVHYSPDGKAYCERCYHEMKEKVKA